MTEELSIDLPEARQFKLVDAYTYEIQLSRRGHEAGDPIDRPGLAVGVVGRSPTLTDDRHVVIISAEVRAPYNDNKAMAMLNCSVAGVFQITDPALDLDVFTTREAVVLIYPYLRSTVGQIWRLAALTFPPLPVLDLLQTIQVLDETLAERLRATKAESEPQQAAAPAKRRRAKAATQPSK